MLTARVEPSGICPACGRGTYGGSDWCKARRCPHFAPIWARDQQRKLFENLGSYADGEGHAVMLTVTAPGVADGLVWDAEVCAPLGPHRHDGRLGCRVDAQRAAEWNATASERWRRLHDRCARVAQSQTGRRPRLLARAWEVQSRGLLHLHAVVARGEHLDRLAAAAYAEQLRARAGTYGFGWVDEPVGRARAASESAAYISSYLSRGKGRKRTLGETVLSDELPRSVIHVSVRLTMATGVTMRALRLRRLVAARWSLSLPFLEQRGLQRLLEAFPGAELVRGPPIGAIVERR